MQVISSCGVNVSDIWKHAVDVQTELKNNVFLLQNAVEWFVSFVKNQVEFVESAKVKIVNGDDVRTAAL